MPLDPAVAAFLAAHAAGPPMHRMSVADLRAAIEGIVAYCGPVPPVALVRDLPVPGGDGVVPARLYHPRPGTPLPVVVYFHGGGWMSGSVAHVDPVCRRLAHDADAAVLNVGYRLAPAHPFPAALDDARAATAWAAANAAALGGAPGLLAVAGDSAGANLATVVAAYSGDGGGPRLAHQVLICPALDTAMDTDSYRVLADGYGCTRALMRRCWSTYLRLPADRFPEAPWQAVPMRNPDLTGMAPATVITMEFDPLRDEGEAYADRLAAAGVPVTAHRCDGVIHCALHLGAVTPAADLVYAHAAAALRAAFAAGGPPAAALAGSVRGAPDPHP